MTFSSPLSSTRSGWCWNKTTLLGLALVLVSIGLAFLEYPGNRIMTMDDASLNDDDDNAIPSSSRRKNPIRQISILGERNSGTRWTFDHLNECFGHGLEVEKKLTRYKHWFQFDDPSRYPHDTLVILVSRNPYDWLKAMERVPHHSPNHLRTLPNANYSSQNSENDWKIFLTREWTTPRVGKDLELHGNETCQDDFAYRDLVSCVQEPLPHSYYNHTIRYSEHQPFYEMRNDGSGQPYANLLELRTAKILNHLAVREYDGVADVWRVQYEYLLNTGTHHLLQRIQQWTGVAAQCQGIAAQLRKPKKSRLVQPEFARHVRQHLNWTVEAMIGYTIEELREEGPREW